eukprot:gene50212-68258_t
MHPNRPPVRRAASESTQLHALLTARADAAGTAVLAQPRTPDAPMPDRLSANVLIKSVIGVLALVLMASLAFGVKDRWDGLRTSRRTLAVAEVSGEAFRVLLNQRTDRSTT